MANVRAPDPTLGATLPEVISLAYEEGHDADIPSNIGVATTTPQRSPNRGSTGPGLSVKAYQEGHDVGRPTGAAPARRKMGATSAQDSELTVLDKMIMDLEGSGRLGDVEKGEGSITSISFTEPEQAEENEKTEKKEEETDPNIVWWDGPKDPANPLNWSKRKVWSNVGVISAFTFLTPLASSMFAPGVLQVTREFNTTNVPLTSFVVSIYVLGYAFGPLFIAPLSEMFGRMPLYHSCNVLFIVFTIACAVSSSFGMLTGFRFLAGVAGSAPLTLGGGTIADLIPQQRRGAAMAIWAMGPLMGPVIGPVAGGYLAESAGWRWIFWVIAIAGAVVEGGGAIVMRETYAVAILNKKTKRLRKETGNTALRSKLDTGLSPRKLFFRSIVRPAKLLLFSPIVSLLSLYIAIVYGYLYLLFTTFPMVFENQYGFSSGSVGLCYLGLGIGSFIGLIIIGGASDRIVKKKSAANGGMKPEYRLPPMIPASFCIPIGLFWYGWSAQAKVHWIMPIIGTMWVGIGLLGAFMPVNTYLVDAFTLHAASAMAANTVLRSIFGAVLPLAGEKMYQRLGLGWGNSLLAFIALAFGPPSAIVFERYGERIRTSERFRVDL